MVQEEDGVYPLSTSEPLLLKDSTKKGLAVDGVGDRPHIAARAGPARVIDVVLRSKQGVHGRVEALAPHRPFDLGLEVQSSLLSDVILDHVFDRGWRDKVLGVQEGVRELEGVDPLVLIRLRGVAALDDVRPMRWSASAREL